VGGLSLLLMHCAAHISTSQMRTDSDPAFQRVFFKVPYTPAQLEQDKKECDNDLMSCSHFQVLQVGLSELFHARLGLIVSDDEKAKDMTSDAALDGLLLERVQKPSPGIFTEDVSLIYFAVFAPYFLSSCCKVIHWDVADAIG